MSIMHSSERCPSFAHRLALTCALATMLLGAAVPTAAHAQLGRLKDAVKKQVTGKGTEQKPAEPARSPSATLMTSDRLDQFFAAVDPWMNKVAAYNAELAKEKQYEANTAKFQECRNRVVSNPANAGKSDLKEIDRLNARVEQLNGRSMQAHMSGDTATARILTDSMTLAIQQMEYAQFPALKQCGAAPTKPSTPTAPRFEVSDEGRQAFTAHQLGYTRERLLVYTTYKSNGNDQALSRAFQPDEIAALDARRDQVDRFAAAIRVTKTNWATWGDLHNW